MSLCACLFFFMHVLSLSSQVGSMYSHISEFLAGVCEDLMYPAGPNLSLLGLLRALSHLPC